MQAALGGAAILVDEDAPLVARRFVSSVEEAGQLLDLQRP
jgi:hypothetical protein